MPKGSENANPSILPTATTAETNKALFLRVTLLSCLSVVLLIASVALALPVTSQYVYYSIGRKYFTSTNQSIVQSVPCEENETSQDAGLQKTVQEEAARFQMYVSLAAGIPSIIFNILIGSYSDYLGRTLLFVLPVVGLFLQDVFYIFIILYELDLYLLIVAVVIGNFCGGFQTFLVAVLSASADVTPPKGKRTIAIALIEGTLGISNAIFGLVAGPLIAFTGYLYLAVLAVGLVVGSGLVSAVFLPRTVNPKQARKSLSPLLHLQSALSFYTTGPLRRRLLFTLCVATLILYLQALYGPMFISTLYQMNRPFCWGALQISYYTAVNGVLNSLGSSVLVIILQRYMALEFVAALGLLSGVALNLTQGLAHTSATLFIGSALGLACLSPATGIRSIMSRLAPPDKQGALFSGTAFFGSLCTLVSGVLYPAIYSSTLGLHRGFAYFVISGCYFLAVLLMLLFHWVSKGEETTSPKEELSEPPKPASDDVTSKPPVTSSV